MTLPLNLFVFITLAIIILVLVFYNRKRTPFGAYVLLFLALFVLGKFTIRSYLYPSQRIFSNSRYHFLEHQGFRFSGNQPVVLAGGQNANNAIYNEYKGDLSIDGKNGKYTVTANRFEAPLYIAGDTGTAIKKLSFSLANAPSDFNAANGFVMEAGGERLQCTIQPDGDHARYMFSYTLNNGAPLSDTSTFRQTIKYGLPLMTLLRQTGLPISDNLEDRCSHLLLVRDEVYGNTDKDNNSALRLFPDNESVNDVRFADLQQHPVVISKNTRQTAAIAENQLFYIGYMQRAANNTDDAVWYMEDAPGKNGRQLKLLMPERFELPANDSVLATNKVLFVASGSDDVIKHNFGAGYLLPWFNDNPASRLHTMSYFSYTPGSARDSLLFNVVDMQGEKPPFTVHGNQPFLLETNNSNIQWIFSFANMHEQSFLQAKSMEGVLGLFIIGVLLILLLVQRHHQTAKLFAPSETGQAIPRLELVIYIAIIPFLILRLLILWRITVFPPTKSIDYLQWADYLNREHFYQLIAYGILPFFVIRIIVLLAQQFRLYNRYFKDKNTFRQQLKKLSGDIKITALLMLVAIAASVLYTAKYLDARYALFLFLVYLGALGVSLLTIVRVQSLSLRKAVNITLPARWEKMMQGPLWKAVLKGIGSCLVLFLAGGITGYVFGKVSVFLGPLQRFMNVFVPVCLFLYLYWRWLPGRHVYHKRFRQHFWLRLMAAAFISGILLLTDSGFSIIFIFFSSIIFIAELFYFYLNLSIGHKKIAWAGAAVLVALLLGFSYAITYAYKLNGVREVVNRVLGENNNIKYRALVQTSQEDKLASGLYFREEAFTRLQNASANKWFINYYLNQNHDHYFSLQQHMDFGVSYPVQTMDLLVLRYIVAEHGEWLVVLLLALLLSVSFASGLGYRYSDGVANANQYVSFAAALLVFVIGFMVWLASTNRFIFFGQDFPLLSIQAKITTLLFFVFLLVVIANNRESKLRKGFETSGNIMLHLFLLLTVIFFFAFSKKTGNTSYNMNYVVQQVEDKCRQLNTTFLSFQQELQEEGSLPADFKQLLRQFRDSTEGKTFEQQNIAEKDSLPFVYSVMDRLLQPNTDRYNPAQLVHVVRNNNGLYEFAVNRHYFEVKPPSAEHIEWKGSLVAAFSQKNISVLHGQADEQFNDSAAFKLLQEQGDAGIAYYPAGALADPNEQLLIYAGDKGAGAQPVIIHEKNDRVFAASGVYRLPANAWLQLVNGKKRSDYFIREGQSEYLARSIWMNGGYRLIYPFKDRFIWPYNMGNTVAQAFAGTDKANKDFVTSLDKKLHDANEESLLAFEQNSKVNDSLRKQFISVAIVNGEGYMWDIQELDFSRRNRPSFNPNNSSDHFRFMRQLYSRRNATVERNVLGHQALLNMYNPGSTMKPFIYAATMSGNRLAWDSLVFLNRNKEQFTEIDKNDRADRAKRRVLSFAGQNLIKGFAHDISDNEMAPVNYIAKSTNMYHSMIVYLGSYPAESLNPVNLAQIMVGLDSTPNNKNNFPIFRYKGNERIFNPKNLPRDKTGKKYFGNPNSILADKLERNFSLATSVAALQGDSAVMRDLTQTDKSNFRQSTTFTQYAFPEKSAFQEFERDVTRFGERNGLTNPTVGAIVTTVSPIKMAEMGARLFTANRDMRLRMNREDTATYYKPFMPGLNYNGVDDLLDMYRKTLFSGMHKAVEYGTAHELLRISDIAAGWFVYAKTGTADQENAGLRHKTLLVVLSKINMHDGAPLTADSLKNNKVICFYFSFFNHGGYNWNDADRALIRNVIGNALQSQSAKKYQAN